MSLIDYFIVAFILLMTFFGYKKGILISICSLISWVVGVPAALFVSENYSETVYDYFASVDFMIKHFNKPVLVVIIDVLLFLLVIIAVKIVIHIIYSIICKNKDKDSPVRKVNSALGGIFGFVKSAVLLLVFASVIFYFQQHDVISKDNAFMQQCSNSAIIEYLNSFNPLTRGL